MERTPRNRLEERRWALSLSQKELADLVAEETGTTISDASISRYESGLRKRGHHTKTRPLAEVVGVPVAKLFAAPEEST